MLSDRRCDVLLLALAFWNLSCAAVKNQASPQAYGAAPAQTQSAAAVTAAPAEDLESAGSGGTGIQLVSAETATATPESRLTAKSGSMAQRSESSDTTAPSIPPGNDTGLDPQPDHTVIPPNDPPQPTPKVLPDSLALNLKPAPVEDGDHAFPINLATALRLADARPLIIAAAQASAWVAEAQLQRAQLLWVPQFDLGALYYRHDGFGPDFNYGVNNPRYGGPTPGGPLNQNLNYFYAYGSFYQSVNLTDAIFQPLAARQTLDAQRLDIQTAKNDSLLATADAYFEVHQHRGQYAATLHVVDLSEQLVERVDGLAKDLVPEVEVARARRLHASLLQRAASARERWRVSSANLTQTLRLDPSAIVVPLEHDHLQITLVDLARPLDELIAIGVSHRPEIPANAARVRAAEARVRREKNRPLLPLLLITGFQTPGGMMSQFGVFGTGADTSLNQWSLRNDVSLQAVWQLEGFGFGNLARIKDERGQESKAIVALFKQQDTVAAQVTAAQARAQAASVRVLQTERELREAVVNYDGNYEGLAETTRFDDVLQQVIRPQEAIRALDQLMSAYDVYFATVSEYNRAQFDLYHALGYPARDISECHPPGSPVSVELGRPYGLPTVTEGPPAANR